MKIKYNIILKAHKIILNNFIYLAFLLQLTCQSHCMLNWRHLAAIWHAQRLALQHAALV